MNSYHDTTQLPAPERLEAEGKARNQDQEVLAYFRSRWNAERNRPGPGGRRAASDVIRFFAGRIKDSSVRRAMSNLVKAGHLEKLDDKKRSTWGRPEHYHVYKPRPVAGVQQTLF